MVKGVRKSAGYVGGIAAKEITYGESGWHPHTHDIEYCEREVSLEDFAALIHAYYEYLSQFYSRNGFDGLSGQHGVRVEQVKLDGVALAKYVAKVQEGADIRLHTAHELTRSDLKQGREGSLMPFDIACEFFETGDMALLDLWHEYERETYRQVSYTLYQGPAGAATVERDGKNRRGISGAPSRRCRCGAVRWLVLPQNCAGAWA